MRLRVPIPPRWRRYPCRDYFASKLALTGWYDEEGQYWYIVPASRVREDKELELLIIGAPGVDGLDWGYRRGHAVTPAHPKVGHQLTAHPKPEPLAGIRRNWAASLPKSLSPLPRKSALSLNFPNF